MEDEHGNLSSVSGEGVSELHVNVSDETFLGQNENPVEDSYVVEDGGEIMVEIVGSDVFLDGMRPKNENTHVVSRDLEVKCSESVAVCGISSCGDETVDYDDSANANHGVADAELVKDPVEAAAGEIGGAEVDTDVRETIDDAMDNKGAPDHVNDSVEAATEGGSGVGMMVTEESTIEGEGAGDNSSNDKKIETPQVNVVDVDKPRENGEGIDTELIEELLDCQGTATTQELDAHTENICISPNDVENQAAENNPVVNAEQGSYNLVEENGSPQNKESEVSLQESEEKHDGVDIPENVGVATSGDEVNRSRESEENNSSKSYGNLSSETRLVDMEMETELYQKYQQEDSSKIHDNHSSETRLVDVRKETELYQDYHQEEEVDAETEQLRDEVVSSRKRKDLNPLTDGPDKTANSNAADASASPEQNTKPSFKIGECILRVASQLTGGTPMVVNEISAGSSSVIDMLSQFQIVAQDPSKPHKFRDEILTFFSSFRSSVVATKRVRKNKGDKSVDGSAEDFEFIDAKDSYWTDRIVQNNPEKQTLHDNVNGDEMPQLAVPVNGAKPATSGRKPQSRKKRYFTGHIPNTSDEVEEKAKRMKQENSPAELILNFAERKCIPSEINLNKMFRRFGPLMESETEVDYVSGRARVIFKRGSDAEVAHNSSQKFNIFGLVLVNYQIGYSPLISVKISPLEIPRSHEDAT